MCFCLECQTESDAVACAASVEETADCHSAVGGIAETASSTYYIICARCRSCRVCLMIAVIVAKQIAAPFHHIAAHIVDA